MHISDVVLQPDLARKGIPAALAVGPRIQPWSRDLELSANEPLTLVSRPDVRVQIGISCKPPRATIIGTITSLPIFQRFSRVPHLNVRLQLPLRRGLEVTEHALLVVTFDMCLQQDIRGKPHPLLAPVHHRFQPTFTAPVFDLAMLTLLVTVQRAFRVKCHPTISG